MGITYFRIRGMWHIDGPVKVFNYLDETKNDDFEINALILESKYNSFPKEDIQALENTQGDKLKISDVKIKSPNNPANLLNAKLIQIKL